MCCRRRYWIKFFGRGLEAGYPPELWCVERPDEVIRLHAAFLSAPADTSIDQASCLLEPIEDPCGLWDWPEGINDGSPNWAATAKGAYHYATYNYLAWDGVDHFGWADCRDACLADAQCVGASIEASGESEGMVCKLVAKTEAPGYSFRNDLINTKQAEAYGWGDRDESPQSASTGAVLSVCPAPAP